jgi:8-oxo-dGTP pyrophosphatase MutT (NUDIX family)
MNNVRSSSLFLCSLTVLAIVPMILAKSFFIVPTSFLLKSFISPSIRHFQDDCGVFSCSKSLTIKDEIMYHGFRDVVKRTVKLPNDKIFAFDILKHRHESVVVFNWNTKTKTTTLIYEYNPGPEQSLFGTVAGMYEKNKHSSSLECAQHELEEEAHLSPSNPSADWYPLLENSTVSMPFDKYSNNKFYPFLALNCARVENPRALDDEEHIAIIENVSYKEIMDLIKKGKMNVVSAYTCLLGFQKLDELGIDYR